MFRALISTLVFPVVATIILMVSFPVDCLAQGIIGKMEADGVWAKYKYTLKYYQPEGDPTENFMEVTVRSVGNKYIGMDAYRWIEIEISPQKDQTRDALIYKMLFKESQLEKGNPNINDVKEFWYCDGNQTGKGVYKVESLSEMAALGDWFFPLPAKNEKQLDAKAIATSLGEFKCRGIYWDYGGKGEIRSTVREHNAYYNDEVPFGLVSYECKQRNSSEKPSHNVGVFLVLDSHGVGAKSAYPNIK